MASPKTPKLESLSKLATIITAIVAAASMSIGLITYLRNSESQRDTLTYQTFAAYSKLCLEYPEYAAGHDSSSIKAPYQLSEKYLNFADIALYSGETILALNPSDPAWIETVRDIIITHKDYIQSDQFPWKNYGQQMISLIHTTLPKVSPSIGK